MTILFFDTETTGIPSYSLPNGDPAQPRCVQLAALMTDDDGQEIQSVSVIIRPDGWKIPKDVAAIHGITTYFALRHGVREQVAQVLFWDLMSRADLIVAHNIKFDRQVIATMFARAGRREFKFPPSFCTADAATPIVNLPPTEKMVAAGFNRPKTPKLEECIRHFFGETLDGAHDALVDVRACARVFFEIKRRERDEAGEAA